MACCNVTYVIKTVTPEAVETAFARQIRNALSCKMDAAEEGKPGSYFHQLGISLPYVSLSPLVSGSFVDAGQVSLPCCF